MDWLALQIKLKEENRAKENLFSQGFQSYFPYMYVLDEVKNKNKTKKESMFPGYAFVKFTKDIDLKKIDSTRGVVKIVRFGDEYPVLNNDIIRSIKNIEDSSRENPKQLSYKIGEKIIIKSGPLKDQQGTVTGIVLNQRIEILYSMLNRAHLIQIKIDNIHKL